MAFDSLKYFRDKSDKPDLTNYYHYPEAFTADEIDKIKKYADEIDAESGTVGDGIIINSMRSSKLKWLYPDNPKYNWLYEKLAWYINDANSNMWGFDISGFTEAAQFTSYLASEQGKYHFHTDVGGTAAHRKVSIIVQLSDPKDYDGGDLQIYTVKEPMSMQKKKGSAIVFPSYLLHRVTEVTRGQRDSLVLWASGPSFK